MVKGSLNADSGISQTERRTLARVSFLRSTREHTHLGRRRPVAKDSVAFAKMLDLLRRYHRADCADNRDRLYALYGMSLKTKIDRKHQTKLINSCPPDYSMHYSKVYTNFAAAAIESGYIDKVMQHAFELGSLNQQEESWPSWVPSWNKEKTFIGTQYVVTYQTRRPRSLNEVSPWDTMLEPEEKKLWTTDDPRTTHVYGSRALHLHGCIHRLGDVQLCAEGVDVIAYFQTVLSRHSLVEQDPLACKYKIALLITTTLLYVPRLFPEIRLDRDGSIGSDNVSFSGLATKRVLGLPLEVRPEEQFKLKEDKFRRELTRVLKGLYLFSYECDGSPEIGITTAEVRPGDFVFRTTEALSQDTEDGPLLPSLCGWLIRPHHQSSMTGPATFRLLGWCIDYYPDVKDPEIVEIILV